MQPLLEESSVRTSVRRRRRTRKKTRPIARILLIAVCFCIYVVLSTGALALYGPFENLRSTLIGMVLTSRHPWWIEPFYSAETLAKYKPIGLDEMERGTLNAHNYSSVDDQGIEVVPIKTAKYSGALLIVHDPKRVHVAVTKHLNSVGETVSDMVNGAGGIAGINAGGFFDRQGLGTGGIPMGITISRGKYISGDKTTLQPVIGITKNGALVVGKYRYDELVKLQVEDAISFGPALVQDGKPYLKSSDGSWGIAPRSAIGQREDGAIMLLAISGRGNNGLGASLLDCQEIMLQHGAFVAGNLDGGYSTELYYDKEFIVPPSNPLGERFVATSFIVDDVSAP